MNVMVNELGLHPDAITLSAMINACAQNGDKEGLSRIEIMIIAFIRECNNHFVDATYKTQGP